LHGELAVGALELLLRAGTRDAQHLVVVALAVTGQNGSLLIYAEP
jgi:hypothetical protein